MANSFMEVMLHARKGEKESSDDDRKPRHGFVIIIVQLNGFLANWLPLIGTTRFSCRLLIPDFLYGKPANLHNNTLTNFRSVCVCNALSQATFCFNYCYESPEFGSTMQRIFDPKRSANFAVFVTNIIKPVIE